MPASPVDRVTAALDSAVPDRTGLSTQQVADAALVCLSVLDPTGEASEKELSDRTIRYYQQRGIVTPPEGRTSVARYGRRQVAEVVGTRIANVLHREPLDAIADRVAGLSEEPLIQWVASLLPDESPVADPSSAAPPSLRPSRISERVRIELAAGVFVDLPSDHPVLARSDLAEMLNRWAAQLLE